MSTAQQTRVIARTEGKLIARNKTVLFSATLFPLALTALYLIQDAEGPMAAAGLTSIMVSIFSSMTVYMTVTLTAVSRRQDLYLKRLRSGESSDVAIFAGITLPTALLCVAQMIVVVVVLSIIGFEVPAEPWWIVAAAVGSIVSCLAMGLGTASVTPNASAAQMTTVPYFLFVIGSVFATPFADSQLMDLTPGGAVVTFARLAFEVPTPGSALTAAAGLLVWTVVGIELARRFFRWEPRA